VILEIGVAFVSLT